MATTTMDSGLGEAISSYQPKVLSARQWARFRDDALAMVVQLHHPSPHRAIQRLSHLAAFLADVGQARPEASSDELLDREQVDGYLARCVGQVSVSVLGNRQAALNNFLKVDAGIPHRQPARREREPHLEPYSEAEMIRLLAAASTDPCQAAAAFARTIGCVLAGVELPSGGDELEVDVEDGQIEVSGLVWTAPVGLPMPTSGGLSEADVEVGRRWARTTLEVRLDLRRLNLTSLTLLAATRPALVLLTRPGLGRDRLTSLMRGAARPDDATTKQWLRGG